MALPATVRFSFSKGEWPNYSPLPGFHSLLPSILYSARGSFPNRGNIRLLFLPIIQGFINQNCIIWPDHQSPPPGFHLQKGNTAQQPVCLPLSWVSFLERKICSFHLARIWIFHNGFMAALLSFLFEGSPWLPLQGFIHTQKGDNFNTSCLIPPGFLFKE